MLYFSTEFSLRMMGDIQQYFIDNEVRNFYRSRLRYTLRRGESISQLATWRWFTLEAYLARGMDINDFAKSVVLSNGMDPEYGNWSCRRISGL